MVYDKKTDIYIEDFIPDIMEALPDMRPIPWINEPQLNTQVSIET